MSSLNREEYKFVYRFAKKVAVTTASKAMFEDARSTAIMCEVCVGQLSNVSSDRWIWSRRCSMRNIE
jgi:hypothetical protein